MLEKERDKEKELTEEPEEEEPDMTKTEPAIMEAQNKYVSGKLTCSSIYRGQ